MLYDVMAKQREQIERTNAFAMYMRDLKGTVAGLAPPPSDTVTSLREAYATGRIDLGDFSARVEIVLRQAV